MKERLGRLGTLVLGASVVLSGCAPETTRQPEQSGDISGVIRSGITITENNFDQFFTKCSTRDELIQTAKQQERQIFPLLINSPSDLTIEVQPVKKDQNSLDIITANKQITYISPVTGPILDGGNENVDYLLFVDHLSDKTVISTDTEPGSNDTRVEVQVSSMNLKIITYKTGGDNVNQGDPIFSFTSSGPLTLRKVESSGEDAGNFSSDLSTYATRGGKVLFCSTGEVLLPSSGITK